LRSASRIAVGLAAAAALAFLALKISPVEAVPYLIGAAAAGALAGWLAPKRGIVAGVGAIVLGALALSAFVLGQALVAGELGRTFPDCDPCGAGGYAARMLIVSAMLIAAFGPLAGFCGWLGALARASRAARDGIPPAQSSGNERGGG